MSCVGFNTPSVIRWPMESIKHQYPNATLLRINREHSQFPEGVREKAFSFAMDDGTVKRYPTGYAMTLLAWLQAVRGQRKVVIEGDPEHALTKQIIAAV
ncbi:hypothetical protein M3650_28910 [Paenibacillus sp. MER TA 81-3]|uniref:hypothetical protein n=1 Tax=Paenibacillus sp. MER TA 81-3 TaxID=2939573 RepID=UPI00203CE280|nr:hypothetical protein [Paenibacillus sp. MER TA 81-3]MCM3342537.1 hypothetical protein [Paenibacillus sp. MER TA 81-3]